jgi:hypothetical protein
MRFAKPRMDEARDSRAWLQYDENVHKAIHNLISLSVTATLDFTSIAAGGHSDMNVTVKTANPGDEAKLGLPASPTVGIHFSAFVSAVDTVTVRAFNMTSAAIDPASASYRVTVCKY